MARKFVADGVVVLACTPHILPGLYPNTGPAIIEAMRQLQGVLDAEGIPLLLVSGADNHMVPDFVDGLRSGRLLSLNGSRYVLVEPPHHSVPPRMEDFFFDILAHGYVPILTHPERLSWINQNYGIVERLTDGGVWMQITAGSLIGAFGRTARYWSERMLDEGRVHILATDAHDVVRRPPNLSLAHEVAVKRVGMGEAENLVFGRPRGIISNVSPSELQLPERRIAPTRNETRTGAAFAFTRGVRRFFE